MLRTLLRHVGKYKLTTILTPIFAAAEVVMEVLIPFIIALLIDEGINAGDMDAVIRYGLLMVALAFLSLAFGVLAGITAAYSATGFACNLRSAIYRRVQTFSFSNIDRFSTAGLITRLTTDVNNVQMAYQMILRIAVRAPFTMISSLVMAFIVNAQLSVVFLIALLIVGGLIALLSVKVMPIFRRAFDKYDELNAVTQENISGIRVVKAYVREEHENERFQGMARALYKLFVKTDSIMALMAPGMMFGIFASMIALSWLGAQFIVVGDLTTGELTSMFSYLMSILMSLMMLMMIIVMITMSSANARRIAQVLTEESDIVDRPDPVREVADGSIEFDHVLFSYHEGGGDYVLDDINLSIAPGETIGVIGGTGSGKTTLVSLISRLYDVSRGSVRVGGVDVRDYELATLRDEVAVVLQNNVLFSGTIMENLRWGKPDATAQECIEACKAACAHDFIMSFPDGYETHIEQGGSNVSGGQKQRLCIARSLLKRPKVLILDDSTSAVDTATDASIRRSFASHIPGTTKIIISQRVNSVESADRIIVMEDGRIDGFDTHERLLETNEIYSEIYEAQTKGGQDFDALESAALEGGDAR